MYNLSKGGDSLETTVYADVLFFVNFSMDFITLWLSALITSRERSALRMSLASAFGGIYGVLSVFFSLSGTLSYITAFAVSTAMSFIAFGYGGLSSLLKQSALIWGCGALLGGIMTAILSMGSAYYETGASGGSMLSVVAGVAVIIVYFTVRMISSARGRRCVTVEVSFRGQKDSFQALCDSGNLMRDPLCGDPVILISSEITEKLCGSDINRALLNLDTRVLSEKGIPLRIIPHKSTDKKEVLAGFVPDGVTVISDKKKHSVHCVLCPIGTDKKYFAGCAATVPHALLF